MEENAKTKIQSLYERLKKHNEEGVQLQREMETLLHDQEAAPKWMSWPSIKNTLDTETTRPLTPNKRRMALGRAFYAMGMNPGTVNNNDVREYIRLLAMTGLYDKADLDHGVKSYNTAKKEVMA